MLLLMTMIFSHQAVTSSASGKIHFALLSVVRTYSYVYVALYDYPVWRPILLSQDGCRLGVVFVRQGLKGMKSRWWLRHTVAKQLRTLPVTLVVSV